MRIGGCRGSTSSRSSGRTRRRSTRSRPEAVVVLVDGWTAVGGSQCDRLAGDRQLRHVSLRRGRAVRRRALPDGTTRPPRPPGQVVGRLRRDRHAARSAPTSSARSRARAGDALFEVTVRPRLPGGRARAARPRTTARSTRSGRLPLDGLELARDDALLVEHRRDALPPTRRGRDVDCRSTSRPASSSPEVWAALARPRSGACSSRAAARRDAQRACAASGSTPAAATSTSSTSARPRCHREVRRRRPARRAPALRALRRQRTAA